MVVEPFKTKEQLCKRGAAEPGAPPPLLNFTPFGGKGGRLPPLPWERGSSAPFGPEQRTGGDGGRRDDVSRLGQRKQPFLCCCPHGGRRKEDPETGVIRPSLISWGGHRCGHPKRTDSETSGRAPAGGPGATPCWCWSAPGLAPRPARPSRSRRRRRAAPQTPPARTRNKERFRTGTGTGTGGSYPHTCWSSAGEEKRAVVALMMEEKEKEPTPYLEKQHRMKTCWWTPGGRLRPVQSRVGLLNRLELNQQPLCCRGQHKGWNPASGRG